MNKLLEKELLKRFTPMQRCPICDGKGYIIVSGIKQKCDICEGKKIIPMQLIQEPENKPKTKSEKTLL